MNTPEQTGAAGLISHQVLVPICLLAFLLAGLTGCSYREQKKHFDIPEGFARQTLKDFSRKAEVEILFDIQIVGNVRTKTVKGSYHPHDALGIMLEDTDLEYNIESETGAYAVFNRQFSPDKSP